MNYTPNPNCVRRTLRATPHPLCYCILRATPHPRDTPHPIELHRPLLSYTIPVPGVLTNAGIPTTSHIAGHPVARMDHTPKEVVHNLPHPSIVLYISDPPSRITLLHLLQEIKRDIIHCRMNITLPRGPIPLLRIHAHFLSCP
jgi:hypothetical protein